MSDESKPAEVWAVLELMGHVKLAGRIGEEEKFGGRLGRIDVPTPDGGFVTRYFGAAGVYSLTVVSERVARDVAAGCRPQPVSEWDYPKSLPAGPAAPRRYADDDQGGGTDGDEDPADEEDVGF